MEARDMPLASFYEGWERYQGLLSEAVGSLSADQLTLTASPRLRPAWMLAEHIIATRVSWFHRVMGEGDAALEPLLTWDDDDRLPRGAAELTEGLAVTWRMIQSCLDRWTPAVLDDAFVTRRGRTRTRRWIIWHVIEHDLHHGGELFFTLGMHGLPTPDL